MAGRDVIFGEELRAKRLECGHTLRKFAAIVGVSPTYLSQVEQGNIDPPTADRVTEMAKLLGADVDEWIALAGRVPNDLPAIIQQDPKQIPELLRELSGLTPAQLKQLTSQARRMKGKGNS